MIRLIDVSAVQGPVNWAAVAKGGISAAYIKCANGNESADPRFDANVAGARAAGLVVGAYAFGFPLVSHSAGDGRAAEEQARRAFGESHGLGALLGDLPPALDIEWPGPDQWRKWGCSARQILDWGLAWLQEMARLTGRKPVVYTYPWFWSACESSVPSGYAEEFAEYPLWLADYSLPAGQVPAEGQGPRKVAPWGRATLWQHDGTGGLRISGGPDADFSVFLGDEAAFDAFVGRTPPAAA